MTAETIVEKIYYAILDKIEEWLGTGETYDYQLAKLCRELFQDKFAGVIDRAAFIQLADTSAKVNGEKYYIVNLDEKPGGSHWIAVIRAPQSDGTGNVHLYVYDSYGRTITEMFPELVGKKKPHWYVADTDPEQHVLEDNCGQRCIAWLFVAQTFGNQTALLI